MANRKDIRVSVILDVKKNRVNINDLKGGLKYEFNSKDREYILSKLTSNYESLVYNNPLPEDDQSICKSIAAIEDNPKIMKELTWELDLICKYAEKINSYLELNDKMEVAILNREFDDFWQLLEELETICHSFYGISNELLVNELESKFEDSTLLIKEMADFESETKLIISIELARCRIDQKLSYWQYDSLIEQQRKNYPKELSEYIDYINFKFDPTWEDKDKKLLNIPFVIAFDSDFSIIDRYNSIKKIIPIILSQNEINESEKILLSHYSEKISKLISDPYWEKLCLFHSPDRKVSINSRTSIYYDLQDSFLTENYIEVIEKARITLAKHPNFSELYLIFIKSLIIEDRKLKDFINPETELFVFLELLENVLRKEKNYISERDKLLNKFYTFSHLDFAFAIKEFLFNEYNVDIFRNVVYSSFLNIQPLRYNCYDLFKDDYKKIILNSELLNYKTYKNLIDIKSFNPEKKNESVFLRQIRISYLMCFSDYENANSELKNIKELSSQLGWKFVFLETWINRKLIKCNIGLTKYSDAVNLIVDSYFRTGFAYDHFFVRNLAEVICDEEVNEIHDNISISILLHIYNQPQNLIYDSIANFLVAQKLRKPSELISVYDKFDPVKILYFFEKVCIKENIEDSPFINSISELENERIIILNHLKKVNETKITEYNEEILKITKESNIRKGLKQIHESRIFVDTKSIYKIVETEFSDVFEKYLEINDVNITDISTLKLNEHYSKDKVRLTYYFIDPIEEELVPLYLSSNDPWEDSNAVMVPFMRFLYFETLFNSIKQIFVFDESYGFKGFLSMRIRHGTFSNVLRSVFDKHKIVSSLEPNSLEYQNVKYWESKLIQTDKVNIELQNNLKSFSKDIDEIIEKGLSWINIHVNDVSTEPAVFNFDFSVDELIYKYNNRIGRIIDLDVFIHSVFKILYDRLEENLYVLRNKIENELTPLLVNKIDELQQKIILLGLQAQEKSQIMEEIVSCRTEVQVITSQINNWFKVSYNQYLEEFPIDVILKASLDYIDIINTNSISKAKVDIDNTCQLKFDGKYLESFGDLFNNLFDNITGKNKDLEEDLRIRIKIYDDGEQIFITVENNLSSKINFSDLQNTVEKIKENIESYDDTLSSVGFEKGSGYLKICKCISSGLKQKNYNISPSCTENSFCVSINFNIKELIV